MPVISRDYDNILNKVFSIKESDSFFHDKTDSYVFSALCVKAQFYKNPAFDLTSDDYEQIVVDGSSDGGVDVLLADPSSENCDLIIGQSKFYQKINYETVLNALIKMANFYKDMIRGQFENVNEKISKRFLSLYEDIVEESKIIFTFYTSASKNRIDINRLTRKFYEQFTNTSNIELYIFFASDILDEIREAEARRPSVESGKIYIDRAGNILEYGDNAVVVNISAMSLKNLYAQHTISLFSKNLRYHIKTENKVDNAIKSTIDENPNSFWAKNNGINIICDTFRINGKEVELINFSIINGAQTAYVLYKSKNVNNENDFYLTCKIIQAVGNTEDEKNAYSLEIAKAANWQKTIKDIDLKANSPEQVRFARAMREAGIFYHTKRGEEIPKDYKPKYLNADLVIIGKLCLCAIFQLPCMSRNRNSAIYDPKYYEVIFNGNQTQTARICKELLYIYDYFDRTFIKKYDKENKSAPDSQDRISFAHTSRTVCVAFVALVARYRQGNLTDQHISVLDFEGNTDALYDILKNTDNIKNLFPEKLFNQKDKYNIILEKLFNIIIRFGVLLYEAAKLYGHSLTASSFLQADKNYHKILSSQWVNMKPEVKKIIEEINNECS